MAGKRKGSWTSVAIFIGIVMLYSIYSDNSSPPPSKQPQPQPQTSTPRATTLGGMNSYGVNGVRNDWPNMADASVMDLQDKLAKNYYVILDDSGSMKSDSCATGHASRLKAAVDALAAFAEGLPPKANLGLMSFDNGRFSELFPLGKRSSGEIIELTRRMLPGGDTPLATAIARGYEALRRQASAQLGYGEYHLVVITDGQASKGEYPDRIISKILSESPVDVHTIGFCIGKEHVLNQPRYLSYQAADNVQALRQGLQEVLAEAPVFTVTNFE